MKSIMFLLTTILTINLQAQVQIDSTTWGVLDQHETAIAVSPINPKYVIATWNDFRTNIMSKPGYAVSSDGGYTWFMKDTLPPVNLNLRFGFDPSCGFDRYGNVFYAYNTKYGSEPFNRGPVYVSKSINYGMNWSHIPVNQTDGNDKPYIVVDNTGGQYDGRVYVVWWDGNNLYTAYMPKNSNSFQGHLNLTNGIRWGFTAAIGVNGDVFMICRKIRPGRFYIYKSNNGGVSYALIGEVPYIMMGMKISYPSANIVSGRIRRMQSITIPDTIILPFQIYCLFRQLYNFYKAQDLSKALYRRWL